MRISARIPATARSVALLTVLAVAAVGCAGGDDGADPEPAPPAENADDTATEDEPAASLTSGMRMPLDEYHIPPEDQLLLEAARDELISACMARFDQEYAPADQPPSELERYTYLYGVDDPAHAAEHGYMHPIDLEPGTYQPMFPDGLTEDQERALYGDPEAAADPPATLEDAQRLSGPEVNGEDVPITGCYGEAVLTINRPDESWIDPTVVSEIENEAGHHADEDERIAEILDDWSACMADAGFDTDSPLTVTEDLDLVSDVSGETAIEAAVADVACKTETDLVDRWSAIDAEYQEEAISEHAELLDQIVEQHQERMARVTDAD